MKSNLNHFTSKIYLVTYSKVIGLGSVDYGIMSVHNKPQSTQTAIKKLTKEQDKKDSIWKKYTFDLKTIDINNPFSTSLFTYCY